MKKARTDVDGKYVKLMVCSFLDLSDEGCFKSDLVCNICCKNICGEHAKVCLECEARVCELCCVTTEMTCLDCMSNDGKSKKTVW